MLDDESLISLNRIWINQYTWERSLPDPKRKKKTMRSEQKCLMSNVNWKNTKIVSSPSFSINECDSMRNCCRSNKVIVIVSSHVAHQSTTTKTQQTFKMIGAIYAFIPISSRTDKFIRFHSENGEHFSSFKYSDVNLKEQTLILLRIRYSNALFRESL